MRLFENVEHEDVTKQINHCITMKAATSGTALLTVVCQVMAFGGLEAEPPEAKAFL